MKKIANVIIATVMLILCFALSACGNKYSSHYSAKSEKISKESNEASVSFGSFSGTYVMKFKSTGDEKVYISYNATLAEGTVKVYYDFNDEKLGLFEIKDGGSIEGKTEAFTSDTTIYVIIESDGKCGACSFLIALKNAEQ